MLRQPIRSCPPVGPGTSIQSHLPISITRTLYAGERIPLVFGSSASAPRSGFFTRMMQANAPRLSALSTAINPPGLRLHSHIPKAFRPKPLSSPPPRRRSALAFLAIDYRPDRNMNTHSRILEWRDGGAGRSFFCVDRARRVRATVAEAESSSPQGIATFSSVRLRRVCLSKLLLIATTSVSGWAGG